MSDEVSQFLEQVERLRGQQIEDDEVRAREHEEFLAAKRERQAWREERARSISPQKSSPVNTPSPRARRAHLPEALKLQSPPAARDTFAHDLGEPSPMALSSSPVRENEFEGPDAKHPDPSTPAARSSPLSWQRRPSSRAGSRPLSMLAVQNASQRSLAGPQEPASATDATFSKEQRAQASGSKDPAGPLQAADRASRDSQVDDDHGLDMASVKAHLPGTATETPHDRPLSRHGVTSTAQAGGKLSSPVSFSPDKAPAEQAVTSPTGGTSPLRSASPTKGMGGFVQSAMMKRSDSFKRWSVTSPPGLSRADSVAAHRNSYQRGSPQPASRPQSTGRGASPPQGPSRPTSKHGEDEVVQGPVSKADAHRDPSSDPDRASSRDDDAALPTSPTKTADPRRWSPSKSSWLENALKKPESPKPAPKPAPSQPAWMVELNKAKAERASKPGADPSQSPGVTHKHKVSIGGLMRQSPVGDVAKTNPTGLGGIYSPPSNQVRAVFGHQAKTSLADKPSGDEQAATTAERRRLSAARPPQPKPRPETPPNKDLRAGLRQRPAAAADAPRDKEPEFKKAFGNLRRTTTQNYVPPDELKNNIIRGKAALNATDGPRKGERKDEFKEAILKKREDFRKAQSEGKGVTRSPSNADEKPLPEGLAKRAELVRSNSDAKSETSSQEDVKDSGSPRRLPELKRTSDRSASPKSPSTAPAACQSPTPGPAPRDMVPAEPPAGAQGPASPPKEPSPSAEQQQAVASRSGGKLADRFNPALAGILARGPPAMATNGGQGPDGSGPRRSSGDGGIAADENAPGPRLTHMTKGRARGPRRKAPSGSLATTAAKHSESIQPAEPHAQEQRTSPVSTVKVAEQAPPTSPLEVDKAPGSPASARKKPAPLSIQQQVAAQAAVRGQTGLDKSGHKVSAETGPVKSTSPLSARGQPTGPDNENGHQASPPGQSGQGADQIPQPASSRTLDTKRMSTFLDGSLPGSPTKELTKGSPQRSGSRSPTKSSQPTSPAKFPCVNDHAPRSGSPLQSPPSRPEPSGAAEAPGHVSRGPLAINASSVVLESPATTASPQRSPTKQIREVSTLLTDFFGPPGPRKEMRVDTAEMLASRPPGGAKITSLRFQMARIVGDGKEAPVSAQNERVLFEQEMYVCAHSFSDAAGKKASEVYLWVGDEVGEAAAEEARALAQREARSLGGRLVELRQGKETGEFVQALGGIVMVRRGSNNKYDSLAPGMLCGRGYLGQVAFDEVDFAAASLCSGFAYLVARGGQCFLWKGKGSGVAEVGCARLVGMELTLTGELVECDDGAEPASFWDVFGPAAARPHSADHWRLKPSYDKYSSRLFCCDADAQQQVVEVSPFGQSDLSPSRIYVLDAFFEMYIVVGGGARAQYGSFRLALDFAHEYTILAAGIEDRPFVPVSSVVLEGTPRDLKRVFRKWDDARSPTAAPPGGGPLKRGRSLRVVTLTQALLALDE